jgi:hypothetical protein
MLQLLGGVTFLALSLVKWAVIDDGLIHWFGMDGFLTSILSAFITSIPVIGTITSIVGAMDVWGWSFWQASGLFIGPTAALFLIAWLVAMKNGY